MRKWAYIVALMILMSPISAEVVNNTLYVWENTTIFNQTVSENYTAFDFSSLVTEGIIGNYTDVLNTTAGSFCHLPGTNKLATNTTGAQSVTWQIYSVDSYTDYESCSFNTTSNYDNKINITFDNSFVDSDETNVYVKLTLNSTTFPNLSTKTDFACQDFEITTTTGTSIDYEPILCDTGSEVAYLSLKLPDLESSSHNTTIYLYYNNVTAVGDMTAGTGAYESDTRLYVHYQDTVLDASPQGNDGSNSGMSFSTGKFGKSGYCDATADDYVDFGNFDTGMTQLTFTGWYKSSQATSTFAFAKQSSSTYAGFVMIYIPSTSQAFSHSGGGYQWQVWDAGGGLNDGAWHFVALQAGTGGARLSIDGSQVDTDPDTSVNFNGGVNLYACRRQGGTSNDYTGYLDETAIYNTRKSDAWTKIQWASEMNYLQIYGTEEAVTAEYSNVLEFDYTEPCLTQINSLFTVNVLDEADATAYDMDTLSNATLKIEGSTSEYTEDINWTSKQYIAIEEVSHFKLTVTDGVDTYWRRALPTTTHPDTETINLFLTDDVKVLTTLTFDDLTGEFQNADVYLKKIIGDTIYTVVSATLDAEQKLMDYFVKDDKYYLYVNNGEEERSLSFLIMDDPEVDGIEDKSVEIKDIVFASGDETASYTYNWTVYTIDDDIKFYFDDIGDNQTITQLEYSIWNATNTSQVFSSTSTSTVPFSNSYTVTDENQTYGYTVIYDSSVHGEITAQGYVSFAPVALDLDFVGIPPVWLGRFGLTMTFLIALLFGAINSALAGLVASLWFGYTYQLGWYVIFPLISSELVTGLIFFAIINLIGRRGK